MGALVTDLFPGLNLDAVSGALVTPSCFLSIVETLSSLMISDTLTAASVKQVTNRAIYNSLSTFPLPKVVRESRASTSSKFRSPFSNEIPIKQTTFQKIKIIFLYIQQARYQGQTKSLAVYAMVKYRYEFMTYFHSFWLVFELGQKFTSLKFISINNLHNTLIG